MDDLKIDIADTGNINPESQGFNSRRNTKAVQSQEQARMNMLQLKRDTVNNQRFRKRFITDANIWDSITPNICSFKYYTYLDIVDDQLKVIISLAIEIIN